MCLDVLIFFKYLPVDSTTTECPTETTCTTEECLTTVTECLTETTEEQDVFVPLIKIY